MSIRWLCLHLVHAIAAIYPENVRVGKSAVGVYYDGNRKNNCVFCKRFQLARMDVKRDRDFDEYLCHTPIKFGPEIVAPSLICLRCPRNIGEVNLSICLPQSGTAESDFITKSKPESFVNAQYWDNVTGFWPFTRTNYVIGSLKKGKA